MLAKGVAVKTTVRKKSQCFIHAAGGKKKALKIAN